MLFIRKMMKTLQKFGRSNIISKQGFEPISNTSLKESFGFSGVLFLLLMSMVDLESFGTMVSWKDSNTKLTMAIYETISVPTNLGDYLTHVGLSRM